MDTTFSSSKMTAIEALLANPLPTTWIEVVFAMESKSLDLTDFNIAARESFATHKHIQGVVNAKTTPDVSDNSKILSFVETKLAKKKKVNCLGSALAALLIAHSNEIPCKLYCSESHSWVELEDGVIVDVIDNIKAAKKSSKPLSIYSNAKEIDHFSLCMLQIANDNPLSDEEDFYLLNKFQNQLQYSWEFSKLFSLGSKLYKMDSIPEDLLHRDPSSLGLISDRVLHFICEEEDPAGAMAEMNILLDRVSELCVEYNVNTDWWLHPKGSFLNICEEFAAEFKQTGLDIEALYEEWVDRVASLAQVAVPNAYEKFSKSAPKINGKRRRIEKAK